MQVSPGVTSSRCAVRGRVARDLADQRRARADQAHRAAQHAPQLRQFVDAGAADQAADRRDARVALHLEGHALRAVLVGREQLLRARPRHRRASSGTWGRRTRRRRARRAAARTAPARRHAAGWPTRRLQTAAAAAAGPAPRRSRSSARLAAGAGCRCATTRGRARGGRAGGSATGGLRRGLVGHGGASRVGRDAITDARPPPSCDSFVKPARAAAAPRGRLRSRPHPPPPTAAAACRWTSWSSTTSKNHAARCARWCPSSATSAIGADSGRAALDARTRSAGPIVVLVDLLMPELDGFEVTRRIRELTAERWLPVIATSSLQGDEHFIHALAERRRRLPVASGQPGPAGGQAAPLRRRAGPAGAAGEPGATPARHPRQHPRSGAHAGRRRRPSWRSSTAPPRWRLARLDGQAWPVGTPCAALFGVEPCRAAGRRECRVTRATAASTPPSSA